MYKEILKSLEKEIIKKNENIVQLNNDLDNTRNLLELERQLNLKYFDFKNENYSSNEANNYELKLIKISSENTSLKNNIINYEEALNKYKKENESLIETLDILRKQIEDIKIKEKNKFDKLKSSFTNMIKEFRNLSENYSKSKEEINEVLTAKLNIQEELDNINRNYINVEKQNTDILSENEGLRKKIEFYNIENTTLKRQITNKEEKIKSIKLQKQVFYVNYFYYGVPMNGSLTFEDENQNYCIIIENRTATRKYTYLDINIYPDKNDNTKIYIQFIKENNMKEEYYTKERDRLIETYNTLKNKVISVTDIASEDKAKKENQEKVNKTQTQLSNFFGVI